MWYYLLQDGRISFSTRGRSIFWGSAAAEGGTGLLIYLAIDSCGIHACANVVHCERQPHRTLESSGSASLIKRMVERDTPSRNYLACISSRASEERSISNILAVCWGVV
jgi:hypothetical protein